MIEATAYARGRHAGEVRTFCVQAKDATAITLATGAARAFCERNPEFSVCKVSQRKIKEPPKTLIQALIEALF